MNGSFVGLLVSVKYTFKNVRFAPFWALHREFLQRMGIGWMAGVALVVILEENGSENYVFFGILAEMLKENHLLSFGIQIYIALRSGEDLSSHFMRGQFSLSVDASIPVLYTSEEKNHRASFQLYFSLLFLIFFIQLLVL